MLPEPLGPVAAQALRRLIDRPSTRPELAEALGVTKQTASSAIAELEARDLVEAVAVQQGRVGRSALRYALHGGAGWVAGIDLRADRLRVAAARLDGTVVADRVVPTPASATADRTEALEVAAHALAQVAQAMPESEGGLAGVGVAVPRPVPRVLDLVGEDLEGADERLLAALAPVSPAAVWTENDVNCAALAQLRYRPGFAADDVVHLQLGIGVGAAVVVGGRILRGARGRAGEVRELRLPDGRGAEEALSAASLLRAAGRSTDGPLEASLDDLFAAADAEEAVEREAEGVARLLGALVAVIDPEVVVLGGPLGGRAALRERVDEACTRLGLEVPLTADPLGDAGAVLGATWLAADRVLSALAPLR